LKSRTKKRNRDPLEDVIISDDVQYNFECPNCGAWIRMDQLSGLCIKCGEKVNIAPSQKGKLVRADRASKHDEGLRGASRNLAGD
jgi:predicted RNA-binding Zn-ribbon protein involved in translation (DUF1610 family)